MSKSQNIKTLIFRIVVIKYDIKHIPMKVYDFDIYLNTLLNIRDLIKCGLAVVL